MSPVCPQLGGGCRHSPQLEGHSAFLLSTDPPPGRSQICPQHQFMCHSKQEPLLWYFVGEGP